MQAAELEGSMTRHKSLRGTDFLPERHKTANLVSLTAMEVLPSHHVATKHTLTAESSPPYSISQRRMDEAAVRKKERETEAKERDYGRRAAVRRANDAYDAYEAAKAKASHDSPLRDEMGS